MMQQEPDKPLSEQTMEELLATALQLKLELLKNIAKSEQVTAELFLRAHKQIERK